VKTIRMNDFQADGPELIQAQLAAVARVLESGWYVLGKEVEAFESAWAELCGVPHAVGVGNGMDAIEVGMRAAGISSGEEVITTPITAFATVLAIIRAGCVPVLADIDGSTGLLDPASAARCIGPRTRAIMPVHLYGHVAQMNRWIDLCSSSKLLLLEDCAQAHGARWQGAVAGSWGTFGAYSFYPTKNLGTPGDGGALVTRSAVLAESARILRNYGQTVRYHHPYLGLNSRLDEIHAAILSVRLKRLETFTIRRRAIAHRYVSGLNHPMVKPLARPAQIENHVFHLFVVLCDERDRLAQHLAHAGIETLSHYPLPIHHQEKCRDLRRDPAGLNCAERHAATCLSLPCHPHLDDGEVDRVIEAVNAFA
jgi:dTDP-4-amino-4,6-dideoxygalactose transaminase